MTITYNKLIIEAIAGLSVNDDIKCDNTGIYNKNYIIHKNVING